MLYDSKYAFNWFMVQQFNYNLSPQPLPIGLRNDIVQSSLRAANTCADNMCTRIWAAESALVISSGVRNLVPQHPSITFLSAIQYGSIVRKKEYRAEGLDFSLRSK